MTGVPSAPHASGRGRVSGVPPWGDAGCAGSAAASDLELRGAFEHAPTGMAVLDELGVVRACNRALGTLLGRDPGELVGTTLSERAHPDDLALALAVCGSIQEPGASVSRVQCRLVHADGTVVWTSISCSRAPQVPGCPVSLIMHVEDISERKALEAELVHRSLHDPLTGLPNRTLLFDRLEHALARRHRSSTTSCLFLLDLDGFKAVNDDHGHAVGDELLQQFAARLTGLLRPGDTAARLGGDEFVVLCEDTDPAQAPVIAARLRAAASWPFALGSAQAVLSASVGMSAASGDHESPADLLRQADARMYADKRRRRVAEHRPPPG